MFSFLDTKVTLRHLILLGVIVAVPSIGAGALAGSSSTDSLRPAGSVRMVSASSASSVLVTSGYVRVLHVSVTVPSGKTADVQASFSASVAHLIGGGTAFCWGNFTIDHAPPDTKFKPGNQELFGGSESFEPDVFSIGMVGFRSGVGPGTHTVNVYVSPYGDGCAVHERALNVLLNIH